MKVCQLKKTNNSIWQSQFQDFKTYQYTGSQGILIDLAFDPNLDPILQKKIFKINQTLKNEYVDFHLSINKNLIPEIFIKLFPTHQEEILQEYKSGVRYQNPETKELLEKYLLLL